VVIAAETNLYGTPSGTQYQWYTICPPELTGSISPLTSMVAIHASLLASGAAGKAVAGSGNPYGVESEPVALAHPGQVRVRSTRDLSPMSGVVAEPMTTTAAADVVSTLPVGLAQFVGAGVGL
jgi:hypothetical protein